MENTFTTKSAAMYLDVSQARIRKLIKDGRLPAEKMGRDYHILESDVQWFRDYGRKKSGRPKEKSFSSVMLG
ncbi:MAG: excisionase family DNA-binding protein [Chthoniobacterales bacterium]